MSLSVVRVPLDSLEFPHRRQISFKVRERLRRVFKNLSKAGDSEVCIPCTVEEAEFGQILAHLGLSTDQLRRTRGKGQRDLPLLTEIRLSCLYGEHLAAAAKGNKETSLIVHLFSADLLDPLLEIISTFSYEIQQSDGELYQKIVESYCRDEITYGFCMGSLTEPKERNMKMLMRPKNLPMVKALNSLLEIPAMVEQLVLGSIHKWLALHIDEQIIHYLNHISVVWKEGICGGKKILVQSLDIDSIRILQFRTPTVCSGDADTIKRLFDNGTLFPGVTDPGDRDMLRRNVLSRDMVIPSFETLQENIHYVVFAAKILVRHVVDKLPLCKSSKKRSPTIFEVLSSSWVAPMVVKVEANDGKLAEIEGLASPSLAFTQLFLACLRLFPWLRDALPPREDWPQDSFKAEVKMPCVSYVLRLAFESGFRTSKIQAGLSQSMDSGPKPPSLWQEIPDWRGGRPFTRTFWYLRTNGFLPRLAATRRRQPNPEFVLLDMIAAFFGKHTLVLKHGSEDAQGLEDIRESEDAYGLEDIRESEDAYGLEDTHESEDTRMYNYVGRGHALGPEDEQGAGALVARRALDKIRPRRKRAALVAAKTPRHGAGAVPRREAARSVMGGQAIIRNLARKAAEGGGAAPDSIAQLSRPTPGREAAQSTDVVASIQLTDSPAPETLQGVQNPQSESLDPARAAGGVGAVPNSNIFASSLFAQFSRPRPGHEATQGADVAPIQHIVPSVVASFGREAARSIFVANPNWEGSAADISSVLTFEPVNKSRHIPPLARWDQGSSHAAIGPAPPRDDFTLTIPVDRATTESFHTRDDFRLVIPPIRGMKTRKHSRAESEEPDEVTIRQEQSEEPALKRARPAPVLGPLVLPPSVPSVPSLMPPTDKMKRVAARNLRKRNAVILDSRAVQFTMDRVEEDGGSSAQPDQFSINGVEEDGGPSARLDQFSQTEVSLYPPDDEGEEEL